MCISYGMHCKRPWPIDLYVCLAPLAPGKNLAHFETQKPWFLSLHWGVVLQFTSTCGLELAWWLYDMEMPSTLPALCERNPLMTGEFPSQRANNVERWCLICFQLNKLLNNHIAIGLRQQYTNVTLVPETLGIWWVSIPAFSHLTRFHYKVLFASWNFDG